MGLEARGGGAGTHLRGHQDAPSSPILACPGQAAWQRAAGTFMISQLGLGHQEYSRLPVRTQAVSSRPFPFLHSCTSASAPPGADALFWPTGMRGWHNQIMVVKEKLA